MTMTHPNAEANKVSSQVRSDMAGWKHALADGSLSFRSVLEDVPATLRKSTAADLLKHVPGYGPRRNGAFAPIGATRLARLNMAMARCGVNLLTPLSRMTDRQRLALAEAVEQPGVVA